MCAGDNVRFMCLSLGGIFSNCLSRYCDNINTEDGGLCFNKSKCRNKEQIMGCCLFSLCWSKPMKGEILVAMG